MNWTRTKRPGVIAPSRSPLKFLPRLLISARDDHHYVSFDRRPSNIHQSVHKFTFSLRPVRLGTCHLFAPIQSPANTNTRTGGRMQTFWTQQPAHVFDFPYARAMNICDKKGCTKNFIFMVYYYVVSYRIVSAPFNIIFIDVKVRVLYSKHFLYTQLPMRESHGEAPAHTHMTRVILLHFICMNIWWRCRYMYVGCGLLQRARCCRRCLYAVVVWANRWWHYYVVRESFSCLSVPLHIDGKTFLAQAQTTQSWNFFVGMHSHLHFSSTFFTILVLEPVTDASRRRFGFCYECECVVAIIDAAHCGR